MLFRSWPCHWVSVLKHFAFMGSSASLSSFASFLLLHTVPELSKGKRLLWSDLQASLLPLSCLGSLFDWASVRLGLEALLQQNIKQKPGGMIKLIISTAKKTLVCFFARSLCCTLMPACVLELLLLHQSWSLEPDPHSQGLLRFWENKVIIGKQYFCLIS